MSSTGEHVDLARRKIDLGIVYRDMEVSQNGGIPQNGWFIVENSTKVAD